MNMYWPGRAKHLFFVVGLIDKPSDLERAKDIYDRAIKLGVPAVLLLYTKEEVAKATPIPCMASCEADISEAVQFKLQVMWQSEGVILRFVVVGNSSYVDMFIHKAEFTSRSSDE